MVHTLNAAQVIEYHQTREAERSESLNVHSEKTQLKGNSRESHVRLKGEDATRLSFVTEEYVPQKLKNQWEWLD